MNFEWLGRVDPAAGTILHALGWAALLGYVFSRPRAAFQDGAADARRWRDLRLWVLPLALSQLLLYLLF